MKKYIYIYITFLGLLIFSTGCEEDLELFPHDSIAADASFNNVSDFQFALKGLYNGFMADGYYGASSTYASIYFIPDVMSDDVIINGDGRRSRETYYDWRHSEASSSETFWLAGYKVVQRANLILENIGKIEGSDEEPAIKAEALAARAIAHFDLAKLYASAPGSSNGGLGIPYVTSTDASLTPARNSLSDTYTSIVNDLTDAISLAGDATGNTRLTKDAMNALLTRVYLYMGDMDGVISAGEAVNEDIATIEDFPLIWKDDSEASVLWKIKILPINDVQLGVAWMQESSSGIRSEYNVDYELYNLYADNDIRKSAYFETGAFNDVVYNHIIKYRGRTTGNANEVDAKCIRYAEVLLSLAEAYSEKGMDGQALAALDKLRANRYEGFTSGNESGQALKNAIAKERRLELAFEGMRFFDLKRKGLPIQRSNFGDRADGEGQKAEFFTLDATDHRFNMAIGQNEMNANPNMEQNPGY